MHRRRRDANQSLSQHSKRSAIRIPRCTQQFLMSGLLATILPIFGPHNVVFCYSPFALPNVRGSPTVSVYQKPGNSLFRSVWEASSTAPVQATTIRQNRFKSRPDVKHSSSSARRMVLTTPEAIIEQASTQSLLDDLIDESVRTSARRPIMMQFDPSSGWVRWMGSVKTVIMICVI